MIRKRNIEEFALNFAVNAHNRIERVDKFDQFAHPEQVKCVLEECGFHLQKWRIAAIVHDTLEYTTTTYADLKKHFGKEVAEMVFAITNELGRNRMESNRRTWWKINRNPDSLTLKLADYIANIHFYQEPRREKWECERLQMYRKEYPIFRKLMKHRHRDWMLWQELDLLLLKKSRRK